MGGAYEPSGPQPPPPRSIGVPPCHDGGSGSWGGSDMSLSAHYRAQTDASGAVLVGPGGVRLSIPTSGVVAGEWRLSRRESLRYIAKQGGRAIAASGTLLSELTFYCLDPRTNRLEYRLRASAQESQSTFYDRLRCSRASRSAPAGGEDGSQEPSRSSGASSLSLSAD